MDIFKSLNCSNDERLIVNTLLSSLGRSYSIDFKNTDTNRNPLLNIDIFPIEDNISPIPLLFLQNKLNKKNCTDKRYLLKLLQSEYNPKEIWNMKILGTPIKMLFKPVIKKELPKVFDPKDINKLTKLKDKDKDIYEFFNGNINSWLSIYDIIRVANYLNVSNKRDKIQVEFYHSNLKELKSYALTLELNEKILNINKVGNNKIYLILSDNHFRAAYYNSEDLFFFDSGGYTDKTLSELPIIDKYIITPSLEIKFFEDYSINFEKNIKNTYIKNIYYNCEPKRVFFNQFQVQHGNSECSMFLVMFIILLTSIKKNKLELIDVIKLYYSLSCTSDFLVSLIRKTYINSAQDSEELTLYLKENKCEYIDKMEKFQLEKFKELYEAKLKTF